MGKTIKKNTEASPFNGLEPATHEKGQMPISNRLRPKERSDRDRCAIGWSDIYDHSTNPVNTELYTRPRALSPSPVMLVTAQWSPTWNGVCTRGDDQ